MHTFIGFQGHLKRNIFHHLLPVKTQKDSLELSRASLLGMVAYERLWKYEIIICFFAILQVEEYDT